MENKLKVKIIFLLLGVESIIIVFLAGFPFLEIGSGGFYLFFIDGDFDFQLAERIFSFLSIILLDLLLELLVFSKGNFDILLF